MVAIVTSANFGLQNSSATVLGGAGQIGDSRLGEAGTRVTVNAATGNLMVQNQDEMLFGRGIDAGISSHYNSLASYTSNDWQLNFSRMTNTLAGTVNTAGSTIRHYTGDGSYITYTWDATRSAYVGTESDGAYDTLTFDAGTNRWTWTDGATRAWDLYDGANSGRLMESTDASGNKLTYTYTSSRVSRITTANGEYLSLTYTGSLLSSIATYNASNVLIGTRTRYTYDTNTPSRLTTVTVDLTPEDNAISDGKTYVTTYDYVGTSTQISRITQSDGTLLDITYDGSNRVSTLVQTVSTVGGVSTTSTTSFTYNSNNTVVTDQQGNTTTLTYDSKKQLTRLVSQPATAGAPAQALAFTYDASGNLLYSGPSSDPLFSNYATSWNDLASSGSSITTAQSTEIDGGVSVYRRQTNGTMPAAGWNMRLGQGFTAYTPVSPGQNVQFSVYTASSGASALTLNAMWRRADNSLISTSSVALTPGGTLGASGIATANFGSLSATAPAEAVNVEFMVQGTAAGGQHMSVEIAQPLIAVGGSPQATAYAYTYDSKGNRTSMVDVYGVATTYSYDANNQLLTKTEAAGTSVAATTRYVYDTSSRLVYTVSPRGEVTRFVYNSYGQQTSILRYTGLLYLGQGALAEADLNTWAASAPVDKTQLQRTDMAYDARGQIQSVTNFADTDANGAGIVATASTTTYVYDPYGRMLNRQLSGSGATETFVYDGLGRTLSSTDYNGKQTTSVYTQSSTGLQTAVTFANGTVRTSVYNRAGELISVTDSGNGGLTATTSYVYDSVGNLIRTTDASGLKTHYVYDMLGRKVADVAPDGAITVYRYDGNSQLVATIQYANKVTSGQLSTLDGRTGSSAAVPLASVLPAEDTANDRWNWNVYDADGRLIEQIDAQGGVTAHTYDAAGRLIATTEYASKLAAATVTGFKTVAPVRLVLPTADAANDRVTRHFYNSDGQLIGTLDADGYLAQIIYDGGGRKVQTKAYNNATNAANRASGSFATLLADVGSHADDINNWWVYDGRGLLRAEIDGLGNVTTYDEYTPAGYVGRVREGRNISVSTLTALSYDAVNNVQNPITVSELHSNLPATTPQTTDYTYDRYGHVLTKTLILQGGATEVTTYVYDAAYNLMKESTASSTTADGDVDSRTHLIRWDSLGRKGAELTGEGANRIAGLGANPTPADIDAVWASNQISYVYDAAGRLIKTMDSDSRPVFYYYDINGRLAYEVNGTGDVTKYGYNVFGEKTTVTTYTSKISIASLSGGLITSTLTDRVAAIAASASTRTVNFNTLGQISSSVDALNKTTSFEYNAFGELQARVDPLSGATTVRTETLYTRRGLLKTSTADVGGLARVASYTYDAFGRQKTVTDAGNTTTSAYDRAGQLTSQTDALGKTTSFVYDALGRVVQITDRNNKQTSYAFSLFDRQVTVTDANGVVTTTTSNAYGQTVRIAITGGETTTYEYDLDGNLTRTIDGAGTVTHAYSSARVLTRTTDARGIETTYDYDAASRVFRQRVDPTGLNLVTERSYDGKGQVLTVTDANTVVTRYEYDLEGRKLKEIVDNGGLNVTTQWAYDDAGRVVSMTSPAGVVVSYAYDKLSRLTSETLNPGGLNLVTSYEYDAAGNVIKKTDAAGGITRNVYDGNNRLAFTIDPENRVSQYTYDDEGRLIQTKTYNTLYDVAGNRTLAQMTAWIGGKTYLLTRSAYDAGGRLAFSVDAAGAVTAYSYDANDNVTQSVQYAVLYPTGNSGTLSDLASWIVGKTTDARTTTFVYDAAGRVTSKTVDPGTSPKLNLVTSYTYDANGNVLSETDPANRVTRYTYDAADRVNFIINPDNSVRAVSYDKVGRVIATYAYAALHSVSGDRTFAQMKSWADANPTGARVTRTTYDAAGRELYAINAENYVTGYTYNADGQVTQKVEYAAVYTPVNWNVSDANGWASANTANARTTTYAYDGAGRLQQVTDPMGIATRYAYDGMGRTTSVKVAYGTADEAETTYLYWADGQLRREITAAGSGVAEATTWRIYDEQGRVKETRDGFGNGTSYAYSYNSTGLVVTTTNMTNGAVTVSEKNAFGEQIKVTDARGYSGYFYYDAAGRQIAQRDTEDYWTQTVYNNAGEVDYVKRFANKIVNNTITPDADRDNKTSFTYDNAGRVKTSIDGNGKTTSYDYNAFGDRVSMTNAMGAVVTYAYDKRGLMTSQTTPAGVAMDGSTAIATAPAVTTAYTYNAFGNRTQMVEAQGIAGVARTTNYAYDKNNQLITQTGDAVTTTNINGFTWTVTPTQSFSYDLRGNQVTATDANGAVTTSYYDKQNRKTAQVDAVGALTVWAYDDNGNVINQKAYAGTHATGNPAAQPAASGSVRETTYAYDSANRLTATNVLGVPMGSWSLVANGWNSQTATVTTTTTYDLNGNAISQTNGNNNTSYTWYDKLSRKIAAVDAEGYMTKYELDHEGNVVKQTQYVTKLTGTLTAGGTPPAAPGAHADDRITEYQYDHNGQRVKETRKLADYSTVSGNSIVNTTDQDVSATFVYNNLGQVIQKTEATGEVTTFLYDNLGRVAIATTASGLRTLSTYDGLGNLLTTTAGYGTAGAQTTTYTYGPGGRLKDKTDAEGFKITYGYDANGQKTIEWYDRKLSNNTTIREAKQFGYDAIGQLILEGAGSWTGSQYVSVQATDSWYNAYGELMARGTNTNRDLAKAQEYADYDAAGRAWRTNMGDGVAKVYFYDANGNTTLQIQSRYAGTTDLRDIASHGDSLAATDVTRIYSVYNKRNELIDVRRPVSVNLDGTVASGGNVVVDTSGWMKVEYSSVGGPLGPSTDPANYTTVQTKVSFNSAELTTTNGSGVVRIKITANDSPVQVFETTIPAGSTTSGTYSMSFWNGPQPQQGGNFTPKTVSFTIEVSQDSPSGAIPLGTSQFNVQCVPNTTKPALVLSKPVGKALKAAVPNATAVTMYVRPAGSSGGYTAVTASQVRDAANNPVVGAFFVDLTKAPFNSAAGSSWEVKYRATDIDGNVVDAKTGTVTFDGSANPTASAFSTIQVFTPVANGSLWNLNNVAAAVTHSDSTQAFNAFGEVTSQTDARGNTTTFGYNAFGNLVRRTGAQVAVVGENGVTSLMNPVDEYYYDKSGRQIGHRDANGNLMTQVLLAGTGYGGTAGLVTTQYNPDGGSVITTYDIFGNALTVTDAIGAVTANTYDKNNRLIESKHAARTDGSRLIDTYVYDGFGQRIRHTNNVLGGAETTDYDFLGRVTKSVTFGGQTTNYNFTWNARTATGKVIAGQSGIGSWTQTTTNLVGKTATTTTDYFGKIVSSKDFGDHNFTYTYDKAGQLTQQSSTAGQTLTYVYTASGQLGSVTDTATGIKSVFGYDRNGNRIIEGYYRIGSAGSYQNAYITYDALNRVSEIRDANADIKYAYDANGNRRRVETAYVNVDRLGAMTYLASDSATGSPLLKEDYWYKYDSMNRFTLVKGRLDNGAIVKGTTGIDITYNARGDRTSTTHGIDGHVETYTYTADGYLQTVTTGGILGAQRTTDLLGRLTGYTEYKANGTTVLSTRSLTYDADSRVTFETTQIHNDNGTSYTNEITNSYLSGGIDQGVVTGSVNRQYQNGYLTTTVTSATAYTWWNQAKAQTASVSGGTTGQASYAYDANGNLSQVNDSGVGRVVTYQTDSFGQVLSRKETSNGQKGAYRNFFYLEGHGVGDVGNDKLASQTDYAQALAANRSSAMLPSTTNYTSTPTLGGAYGNFEVYQPLNTATVAQTGSTYTVMAGDTLQSVAQTVWGDASLWFLVAEANGLSSGGTLVAGQSLSIPGKIANMHNASGVFKPYNALDAMGNTTPTRPPEPQPPVRKQGCGVVGDIIAVIVAVVVAAVVTSYAGPKAGMSVGEKVLAGALVMGSADVAYQGTRMAVGNQKTFNWSELAASAITGGIAGGAGLISKGLRFENAWDAAKNALQINNIRQHVNMAVGLQEKFDWAGLAVAGITGGISYGLGGIKSLQGVGPVGTRVLTGTASMLASAATKSLLTGQSFGKSVRESLSDAITSTIGNMIGGAIVGAMQNGGASIDEVEAAASVDGMDDTLMGGSGNEALFGGAGKDKVGAGSSTGRWDFLDRLVNGAKNAVSMIGNILGFDGKPGWQPTTTSSAMNFTLERSGEGFASVEGDAVIITAPKPSFLGWISKQYRAFESGLASFVKKASYYSPETLVSYRASELLEGWGHERAAAGVHAAGTFIAEARNSAMGALGGMVKETGNLFYNSNPVGWSVYAAETMGVKVAPGLPNAGPMVESMRGLAGRGLEYADNLRTEKANLWADIGRAAGNHTASWENTSSQGLEAVAARSGKLTGVVVAELATSVFPAAKVTKAGGFARAAGSVESLAAKEALVAAESAPEFVGPLIGKSGYRTTSELSDAVFTRYQAAADRGYANVQALEAQGALVPPKGVPLNTYKGQLVDDFARRDIRGFLVEEGIEDSGLVSVNQRLYNSAGTSYRIPDLRVAGTNRIYDLTLGSKSIFTPQVQDFTTFSGVGRVTIVRPSQIGGSKTVF